MFNLIDSYSAWFSIMIIAVLESLVVYWVYGFHNFANDITMMIGFPPNIYWRACWSFISPALIMVSRGPIGICLNDDNIVKQTSQ
jgi:solute carrier family 6 amino acid transporter-like protein 5/7/9/14